jgi:hypothetical protein
MHRLPAARTLPLTGLLGWAGPGHAGLHAVEVLWACSVPQREFCIMLWRAVPRCAGHVWGA